MIDARTPERELAFFFYAEMAERTGLGERIAIMMDVETALALLAVCQYARRSRLLADRVHWLVDRYAQKLEHELASTPAITECCRRGWLPEYD